MNAVSHAGVAPDAGLVSFFAADHRACDLDWAAVERAADSDPAAAQAAFAHFDAALRNHLAMEEEVLFPAFEAATGMTHGPTTVMRMEHVQMRGLLDQMAQAARGGAWQDVLDHGDTLLMVIGQHNAKEEGMLYPMAQMHLGQEWPEISTKLARYLG